MKCPHCINSKMKVRNSVLLCEVCGYIDSMSLETFKLLTTPNLALMLSNVMPIVSYIRSGGCSYCGEREVLLSLITKQEQEEYRISGICGNCQRKGCKRWKNVNIKI